MPFRQPPMCHHWGMMQRRSFLARFGIAGFALSAQAPVVLAAGSSSSLSSSDAAQGLKAALERGVGVAIASLGKPDGFLGNPKVHIGLPGHLNDAARFLRSIGRGKQVDELETAINRAAEAAVPMARDLLQSAVRSMSVSDARRILTGGETSVTDFFAEKTREPLGKRFLPVVTQATEKVGLAARYNAVAGKAAGAGLVGQEDARIETYVTRKTLDGLYFMIGEEERRIRQDPVGTGSAILRKVFGGLR